MAKQKRSKLTEAEAMEQAKDGAATAFQLNARLSRDPRMQDCFSRRKFLLSSATAVSAAWVTANWPAVLASAQHAHHSAQLAAPPKFEYFTSEQAAEVDALTARIIPTDGTPGAREAGVVFFIDRALKTFARNDRKLYADGLTELQASTREMLSTVGRFSAATPAQQDEILRSFDKNPPSNLRPFRSRSPAQNFFETTRQHTILGFLIDPDSDLHGNRGGAGWQTIGREPDHMFQRPFGYYDKDYPGWQPVADEVEEK
jgi:gluconate 2-dehydrogenase gamma chain